MSSGQLRRDCDDVCVTMREIPKCRRCGEPVERNRNGYHVFEQTHWLCFHYVFEHPIGGGSSDPDIAYVDPGCPARAFDREAGPSWMGAGVASALIECV